MLKKIHIIIVFAILIIGQQACKITNDEDGNIEIDPVFNLDMIENLEQDATLTFIVSAIEMQDCENATIGKNLEKTLSEIDLTLNEIIAPADCNPGASFAETAIDMGALEIDKAYNIIIRLRNTVENIGQLQVTENTVELNLVTQNGFEHVTTQLSRVPRNLIWGYVGYNDDSIAGSLPDDFINDLAEITTTKQLEKGYFGHFTIKDNNDLQLRQSIGFQEVNSFYFNHVNDNQPLIDLLNTYRNGTTSSEIEFKIFTQKGDLL